MGRIIKTDRIKLLNKIPINTIDKKALLKKILEWGKVRKKTFIVYINAHSITTYIENYKYRLAIEKADLIYPDGWGPVLVSKLYSDKLKARINVGDYIDELLSLMNAREWKIFLIGCTKDVLKRTVEAIKSKSPKIYIVGYQDGFFSKIEERRIISMLNKGKPNVVFVGMGVPKQELWIQKNWEKLPNATYICVGGVFHYVAGLKSRAPIWMRDTGFEWAYRLFQEPRRLGYRYTIGNIKFLYYITKALIFYK